MVTLSAGRTLDVQVTSSEDDVMVSADTIRVVDHNQETMDADTQGIESGISRRWAPRAV